MKQTLKFLKSKRLLKSVIPHGGIMRIGVITGIPGWNGIPYVQTKPGRRAFDIGLERHYYDTVNLLEYIGISRNNYP